MRVLYSIFLFCLAAFLLPGCERGSAPEQVRHALPQGVEVIEESNGEITARSLAFHYHDIFDPRLVQIKIQEGLEDVVSRGVSEVDRMRLLRDWVSGQWEESIPDPYPPWDALTILKEIRSGKTGGFCAQYAVVLVQASLSLGWQARYLAIATRERPDNGHMTVEIWSNDLNRWVVIDPYFCADYERDGIPLSSLDIHNALVKNELDGIKINFGNDTRERPPEENMSREQMLAYYFHLAFELRNDHITRPYSFWNRRQEYMSWRDRHTDGRPGIFTLFTSEEEDFNFKVNQVEIMLAQGTEPDRLTCSLRTNMPSMKTVLLKQGEGPWRPAPLRGSLSRLYGSVFIYDWKLKAGENSLSARAVNELGVSGPVSKISVSLGK